jgi:hypothetical protein
MAASIGKNAEFSGNGSGAVFHMISGNRGKGLISSDSDLLT